MSNFLEAAKKILTMKKQPLHYREITRFAIEEGVLSTEGLTPEASMNALIAGDIKKNGMSSNFVKMGKGVFTLNDNKIDFRFF